MTPYLFHQRQESDRDHVPADLLHQFMLAYSRLAPFGTLMYEPGHHAVLDAISATLFVLGRQSKKPVGLLVTSCGWSDKKC